MNLVERSNNSVSKVLAHYTSLEVVKGKGSFLFDKTGNKYLDFASGIAVTNTGHCHPAVVKSAAAQLKKIIHNCAGVTYNETNIGFAEDLQKVVPIKESRMFLCQSGSEAIEGALKAAKYATKKSGIIALSLGFHGRTMGALSVTTSKDLYREGFGELMPNTFIAEHNMDSIKKLNNGNIAAVLFELVQGEAGYIAENKQFVAELRKYCTENNILLVIDEVQSGFGRTGKMFACEWYGLEPDIITMSKGIASGLPLGAVVMKNTISDAWKTSTHGGTFTGNLVSCAAARATIKVIKKELPKMQKKTEMFEKIIDSFIRQYPQYFIARTGLGFMIGLVCKDGATNKLIREKALGNGLLLINCGPEGNVLRLAPPITIKLKELELFGELLDKTLKQL